MNDISRNNLNHSKVGGYIQQKEAVEEKTQQQGISLSGYVLVVDDVKTNQAIAKALLTKMGLEVTIAEDGIHAVEQALSRDFDIIFMDIQMPRMNGYEATRVLREKGVTVPIVALTASAMKGDNMKCYEAGCDDYLTKPIDYHALLKITGKYLSVKEEVCVPTRDCPEPVERVI